MDVTGRKKLLSTVPHSTSSAKVNHAHLHIFPVDLPDVESVEDRVLGYFVKNAGQPDVILKSWGLVIATSLCLQRAVFRVREGAGLDGCCKGQGPALAICPASSD